MSGRNFDCLVAVLDSLVGYNLDSPLAIFDRLVTRNSFDYLAAVVTVVAAVWLQSVLHELDQEVANLRMISNLKMPRKNSSNVRQAVQLSAG